MSTLELTGSLAKIKTMSGELSVPLILDRTAIHYDTKETWNSKKNYIGEKGHIYVYSNYSSKTLDDGTVVKVPALKIGDGEAYLIDLPYIKTEDETKEIIETIEEEITTLQEAVETHVTDTDAHLSEEDRYNLEHPQLQYEVTESDPENLVFTH